MDNSGNNPLIAIGLMYIAIGLMYLILSQGKIYSNENQDNEFLGLCFVSK